MMNIFRIAQRKETRMNIYDNVQKIAKSKRITIKEIAKATGLSRDSIGKWNEQHGKHSCSHLSLDECKSRTTLENQTTKYAKNRIK